MRRRVSRFRLSKRLAVLALLAMLWPATLPAAANPPDIADIKWIHEDADLIAALTRTRAECGVATANAERMYAIRLGRVAFRSPVLLGGLAARVGISCNACHPNGHENPAFFVLGVTGRPGTADVTGSVFSTERDDHIFNPVPIPSLIDVAARPSFGSVAPVEDLPTFLKAAIVDEFQGQPPPSSVADALLAYVTSLQSSACKDPPSIAVSFEADANELRDTLALVVASLDRNEPRAADFVLLSLRAALGRIYQRFPESIAAREKLVGLSRSLADARQRLEDGGGVPEARSTLEAVGERMEVAIQQLKIKAPESFYTASVLRAALGSSR